MNLTMVELNDETPEYWHRFGTNYQQLNEDHKTKIKVSKIKSLFNLMFLSHNNSYIDMEYPNSDIK